MKHATAQARRSTDEIPRLSTTYCVRYDRLREQALPQVVADIARLFDGTRNVEQVAREARISTAKCEEVVKKLTALSVLLAVRADGPLAEQSLPPAEQRLPPLEHDGFTQLDHQFFTTEIPSIDECDEPFVTWGDRVRAALAELIVRMRKQHSFM